MSLKSALADLVAKLEGEHPEAHAAVASQIEAVKAHLGQADETPETEKAEGAGAA